MDLDAFIAGVLMFGGGLFLFLTAAEGFDIVVGVIVALLGAGMLWTSLFGVLDDYDDGDSDGY